MSRRTELGDGNLAHGISGQRSTHGTEFAIDRLQGERDSGRSTAVPTPHALGEILARREVLHGGVAGAQQAAPHVVVAGVGAVEALGGLAFEGAGGGEREVAVQVVARADGQGR